MEDQNKAIEVCIRVTRAALRNGCGYVLRVAIIANGGDKLGEPVVEGDHGFMTQCCDSEGNHFVRLAGCGISLWPEKISSLSVDDGHKIQVPNVVSRWGCVLMEELFDQNLGHRITKTALEARNTRIRPKHLAQRNKYKPYIHCHYSTDDRRIAGTG
ncbi:uncharacterized protein PADG_06402 [Paracoccidioides brasiliensis Pb18]|uniref:Uncharacterized protein n=1 Tax=Paracoccidioides brasiliensis (strain Pb18) TaxID=502780 RepID=C1GGG5_PARBD|nr:uncharacterized protein PADG_06402 [Paracoccidioides brasiliensis Pb18]EEH50323.2 hypothetical protein PADG_06402 [Paracoccidioides brasiliensis Pb18]